MRRSHFSLVAGFLAVAMSLVLVSIAFAHAEYVSSVPAAGSTVTSVPAVVKTIHSEAINPKGSSLTVIGPNGQQADQGDGHVDLTDPNRVTMVVSMKPGLGQGQYTVKWATVSALDGDAANESFVFSVGPVASPGPALPKTGGMPIALPITLALGLLALGGAIRRRAR